MKLTITPAASQWFKSEFALQGNQGVHFFGKVYGSSPVHEGFSIGMEVAEPTRPLIETQADGILFFVEENDDWFFSGFDLEVDYDAKKDEPIFNYLVND